MTSPDTADIWIKNLLFRTWKFYRRCNQILTQPVSKVLFELYLLHIQRFRVFWSTETMPKNQLVTSFQPPLCWRLRIRGTVYPHLEKWFFRIWLSSVLWKSWCILCRCCTHRLLYCISTHYRAVLRPRTTLLQRARRNSGVIFTETSLFLYFLCPAVEWNCRNNIQEYVLCETCAQNWDELAHSLPIDLVGNQQPLGE